MMKTNIFSLLFCLTTIALIMMAGLAGAQTIARCTTPGMPCPDGYLCNDDAMLCVLKCSADIECEDYYSINGDYAPNQTMCEDGRCVARECYHDWECLSHKCSNGRCDPYHQLTCEDEYCREMYGPYSKCSPSAQVMSCSTQTCNDKLGCLDGQQCVGGICVSKWCNSNKDCYKKYGPKSQCIHGLCRAEVCDAVPFGKRSQCSPGFNLSCDPTINQCVNECTSDGDCNAHYGTSSRCDLITKKCIPTTCDTSLTNDETCSGFHECDPYDSTCVAWRECLEDKDCHGKYGSGSQCGEYSGRCTQEACDASDPAKAVCSDEELRCVGKSCLRVLLPGDDCTSHEGCQTVDPFARCLSVYDNVEQEYRDMCVGRECTAETETEPDSCPENFKCHPTLNYCTPMICNDKYPETRCAPPYTCHAFTTLCEIHCVTDEICEKVYGPNTPCVNGQCQWNDDSRCINDNQCQHKNTNGVLSRCEKGAGRCVQQNSCSYLDCGGEFEATYYGSESRCMHPHTGRCTNLRTCPDGQHQCSGDNLCNNSSICVKPECTENSDCFREYGKNAQCDLNSYLCKSQPCGYPGYAVDCPIGFQCKENECRPTRCTTDRDCLNDYGVNATCDTSTETCIPQPCVEYSDCPGGLHCVAHEHDNLCLPSECGVDSVCQDIYGQHSTCNTFTRKCTQLSIPCTPRTAVIDCPHDYICNDNNVCENPFISVHSFKAVMSSESTSGGYREFAHTLERLHLHMMTSLVCKPLYSLPAHGKNGYHITYYVRATCSYMEAERIIKAVNDGIIPYESEEEHNKAIMPSELNPVHLQLDSIVMLSDAVPKVCFGGDEHSIECGTIQCPIDCRINSARANYSSMFVVGLAFIIMGILAMEIAY